MARIFLVEDEPSHAELIREVLKTGGHSITVCGDGAEALERIRRAACDLVVCDLMIPGLNGIELLDALSRDPERADIPAIVVTALHPAKRTAESLRNVRHFFTKPFSLIDLRDQVSMALCRSPEEVR